MSGLEKKEEIEKVFIFIRDMAEDMEEKEKKELLGIFFRNPQKLKILPGLEDVFKKFLEACKPNGQRKKSKSTPKEHLNLGKSASSGELDSSVTLESVEAQLDEWSAKNLDEAVLQERLDNCQHASLKQTFSLKWSGIDEMKCVCKICKVLLSLPKRQRNGVVKLSISNITRHMKLCWLNPSFQLDTKDPRKQSLLNEFFAVSTEPANDTWKDTTFVNLVEEEDIGNMKPPPEGTIHFIAEKVESGQEPPCSSKETENGAKRIKLEKHISRISEHQEQSGNTASNSKNVDQPAGI